jgi:hypothetical protein
MSGAMNPKDITELDTLNIANFEVAEIFNSAMDSWLEQENAKLAHLLQCPGKEYCERATGMISRVIREVDKFVEPVRRKGGFLIAQHGRIFAA